jgi:hypothetical protein
MLMTPRQPQTATDTKRRRIHLRVPLVEDARGQMVPLYEPDTLSSRANSAERSTFVDIEASLAHGRAPLTLPIAIIGGVLVLANGAAAMLPFPGVWWRPLVLCVGGLVGGVYLTRLLRRQRAPLVAAAYVARGLCGSCGYDLNHLQPDPDGTVTCPECGAAWRLVGGSSVAVTS